MHCTEFRHFVLNKKLVGRADTKIDLVEHQKTKIWITEHYW